jgi:hypothetical protein
LRRYNKGKGFHNLSPGAKFVERPLGREGSGGAGANGWVGRSRGQDDQDEAKEPLVSREELRTQQLVREETLW